MVRMRLPYVLFDRGAFARVPLIIGTQQDEATLFAYRQPIATVDAWRAHLARRHPGADASVWSSYAVASDSEVHDAGVRWANDWYFHGSSRAVARAVSSRGVPVFEYGFSRVPPLGPVRGVSMGAYHSAEIGYVLGTRFRAQPDRSGAVDVALGRAMSAAWLQFARGGDRNGNGLALWPRYDATTDRHLEFGAEIRAGSGLHAAALDAYDKAFAQMRSSVRARER